MSTDTDLVPVDDSSVEAAEARVAAVEEAVARAREQANAIEVTNEAEANAAGELLKRFKREEKAAEAERRSLVGPIEKSIKKINQKYKEGLAPYAEAFQIIGAKVTTFTTEQNRIREAEEARLEAERQERERIAREAREKQEAEAREKREQAEKEEREAEELRRQAKDKAEREVAEKIAEEAAEKAAEAKTAEDVIVSLPEPMLPKAVVPSAPKIAGISAPKRWFAEVVDFDALPDRLPDGTPLKVVDEVALRQWMLAEVKANDGVAPQLPGAKFEKKASGLAVSS